MKARPTTYKGIPMRSRLEAGFAAWLDRWNFTWEYEPRCFASERGQYLPDFLLRDVKVSDIWVANCYVEVKPNMAAWSGQAATFDLIWESEPRAFGLLAIPSDQSGLGLYMSAGNIWAHWVLASESRLSLALDLPASELPWSGEYWKAG